jgi:hypothetical protein
MKRNFLIVLFFLISSFYLVGCSVAPIPNPGFRIQTVFREWRGLFPIERPAVGSVTYGNWRNDILITPNPPAGNIYTFTRTASSYTAYFDVNGGRAPALWYFDAISGWEGCNNTGTFGEVDPGTETRVTCWQGRIGFPLSPEVVYNDAAAVEIQVNLNNINTTYGMPIFHFENQLGDLVATTTATQVSGYSVKASSSCLIGKPKGQYFVRIYNAPPAAGTDTSDDTAVISPPQPIGTSRISVINTPPDDPPCGNERPYCPDFNYNTCLCP